MRILFVAERGALLRFALLIPALAERGHDVHIAFASGNDWRRWRADETILPPRRAVDLVAELVDRYPGVTSGLAPKRVEPDGLRDVAWVVRAIADLAHNAQPRYAGAEVLRKRTRKRALAPMRDGGGIAFRLGRRLAGPTDARRAALGRRLASSLERAIPTSPAIDRYLRELVPDAVVVTGTFRHVSAEVELVKSARRLGIPSGVFVASWDNLTNKGALKIVPEQLFVWNENQVRDAVDLHGMPEERIVVTGAHVFDEWFERRPTRSREALLAEAGLDTEQPYLAYLCSSRNIVGTDEVDFVRRWIAALRASDDEQLRTIGVVVRLHPNASAPWAGVEFGLENAAVWPAHGVHPVASQARADFFDTLAQAAAVVGINTTAMIEAAILGKSVLTVLVPGFAQETTLHFHDLLAEKGGFLHVAPDLDTHVKQLAPVLDEDVAGAERRTRFVEAFVRPRGIDRPAAPAAAEAVEALAGVPVDPPPRAGIIPRAVVAVAARRAARRSTPAASPPRFSADSSTDTRNVTPTATS